MDRQMAHDGAPAVRPVTSWFCSCLLRLGLAWLLVATPRTAAAEQAAALSLDLDSQRPDARVVVTGASEKLLAAAAEWTAEKWQQAFRVQLLLQGRPVATQLLGDYAIVDRKLVFAPRYPLRTGVAYRATFEPQSGSSDNSSREFSLPSPKVTQTRLTAIFPSRDVVPENLLKFYFHFSAAMSRGEVYRSVQLLDSNGHRVEFPFLELAEELWSPDGKRLTLYFDPGRIKRGLKPRELFGPALLEGGTYTLVVSSDWQDANGNPLAETVKKTFRVTVPDDLQPDIKKWRVKPPPAGSREPLRLLFEEPLDSAMLARVVSVWDSQRNVVRGEIILLQQETEWLLQPEAPWAAGRYQIAVATALEDLAGNSLGRPFEVDVFRPAPNQTDEILATLPLVIVER